jgi:hypothetical protein
MVRITGFIGVFVAASISSASGQSTVWEQAGTVQDRYDALGTSVAAFPDLDQDGVPEILAGSPTLGLGIPGRAAIYSGASGALLHEWIGIDGDDHFGASVANAGDVDGDGIPDVIVGAPGSTTGGYPFGAVSVYSCASGALVFRRSSSQPSWLGYSVAGLGDLNGDGASDVVVGSPSRDAVEVLSGANGSVLFTLTSASPGQLFGWSVDCAGDLDLDGIPDVLVGAPEYLVSGQGGGLFAYSGATGQLLFEQHDPTGVKGFGSVVRRGGDVDGDGRPEVLVGNPWWGHLDHGFWKNVGALWILSGADGSNVYSVIGPEEYFATGLSRCSDVDHDTIPDFVVSAPNFRRLYVHSGATGALIQLFTEPASTSVGRGMPVDATQDFDLDGTNDLLVGAPEFGPWQREAGGCGRARVDSGTTGALVIEVHGESHQSNFGQELAILGDIDGDGTNDVAVAQLGAGSGSVRLLSGADGRDLAQLDGPAAGDAYGAFLLAIADLDHDGIGEVAIGSPGSPSPFSDPEVPGTVEIRSGASGQLLQTFVGPTVGGFYGTAAATGIDASGAVMLAIGAPHSAAGSGAKVGLVDFIDLTTGITRFTLTGSLNGGTFGTSVSTIGDVNGDGFVDWIVGAPFEMGTGATYVGVSRLVSGSDGTTLQTWSNGYGRSSLSAGDFDRDGVPDVLLVYSTYFTHRVDAFSPTTGALLFSLAGPTGSYSLGWTLGRIGDLNRDGIDDFTSAMPNELGSAGISSGVVLVYSGATASVLYRFDGASALDGLGTAVSDARPGVDGDFDGDSIPDLLVSAPGSSSAFLRSGSVTLRRLDDLFLELTPSAAAAGATVEVATRGGPAGNLIGVFGVAFDSVPSGRLIFLGAFDAVGNASIVGTVPSGLSGHTLTLRSYAIGFGSRLVDSENAVLTFL